MVALKMRKTYTAKPSSLAPEWHLFDAALQPLGRLATEVARVLQGKHRAFYTANIKTGDFVVIVNASRVMVTGKKVSQMLVRSHSGYPGGMRTLTLGEMLQRNPAKVIEHAVQGMLPRTTLGRQMLKRMKVYPSVEHPHRAQIAGFGTAEARAREGLAPSTASREG
jgi:large subunit ribosomal protein L13